MTETLSIRRKNTFNLFRESPKLSSFAEFPVLRPEVDPQLHLSRNSVDQPFYLICEKDSVLAQTSGRARVVFQDGPVRHFDMDPGDHVYVPGGTAHRVLTLEVGNQMRYKARVPGKEGVLWYCETCGTELDRHVWDSNSDAPQANYDLACHRHNDEPQRRHCKSCGTDHPTLDLTPFQWRAVVQTLASEDES